MTTASPLSGNSKTAQHRRLDLFMTPTTQGSSSPSCLPDTPLFSSRCYYLGTFPHIMPSKSSPLKQQMTIDVEHDLIRELELLRDVAKRARKSDDKDDDEDLHLSTLLLTTNSLPVYMVCHLIYMALQGLTALHSLDIIHTDFEPDNILIHNLDYSDEEILTKFLPDSPVEIPENRSPKTQHIPHRWTYNSNNGAYGSAAVFSRYACDRNKDFDKDGDLLRRVPAQKPSITLEEALRRNSDSESKIPPGLTDMEEVMSASDVILKGGQAVPTSKRAELLALLNSDSPPHPGPGRTGVENVKQTSGMAELEEEMTCPLTPSSIYDALETKE
ncbi:hypothetical protein GG344DRAFT_77902 [Lentinula edodes]|nr:hypothetical protein GG344DRAFT_77902 [Lentinula edodes]